MARHIGRVLELASAAGHEVVVMVGKEKKGLATQTLQQLSVLPNIRLVKYVSTRSVWKPLLIFTRALLDLGPYFRPDHPSPKLVQRYGKLFPLGVLSVLRRPLMRRLIGHPGARNLLRLIEILVPPPGAVLAMLAKQKPDVVFTAPYLFPNSEDVDYLKAAAKLNIPTCSLVPSWDNMSTKGTGHVPVGRLFVWNEELKLEAEVLHDLNTENVTVTGAPALDHLFRWTPTQSREEFCERAGIWAERPLLLYLCSSGSIAENEAAVVRHFADILANREDTKNCLLLVRPHPLNYKIWQGSDPLPDNARIYPNRGDLPDNPESIEIYCHSIHYSIAMIGLNTSAFLEASVLDRSCIALPTMVRCYDQARFGHFRLLANGNFIHTPRTHAEAASLLGTMLATGEEDRKAARHAFVRYFLRPNGIEREASDVMLDAIVKLAHVPARGGKRREFFIQKPGARLRVNKTNSIVYVLLSLAHFPYHESVVSALARAGFRVYLILLKSSSYRYDERSDSRKNEQHESLGQFVRVNPEVELFDVEKQLFRASNLSARVRLLRSFASYIRRLPPDNFYRQRWLGYMRDHMGTPADRWWLHWLLGLPGAEHVLGWVDQRLPIEDDVRERLRELRPDMVFISPGDMSYNQEVEWLKAAQRLGIRTGIVTLSWDNLTTKGLIHIRPDYLFVWNESHADEAKAIHHMPEKGTFVVGAPFFDKWRHADHLLEARESFLPRIGLDPALRYIVYLGSSANVADNESWLIRDLHAELANSSDSALGNLQIHVRPHPANKKICADLTDLPIILSRDEDAGIPFSDARKRLLFNTLYHAELTVSLNTSAIIDAIAIGKPCISVVTDRYRDTHVGANHFQHLLNAGALVMADGVGDCVRLIAEHLDGADPSRARREDFVRRFILGRVPGMSAGDSIASITRRLLNGEDALDIKRDIDAVPVGRLPRTGQDVH